jgi:hypothetical protein
MIRALSFEAKDPQLPAFLSKPQHHRNRRHDIQPNDIQHDDIQHNCDAQHNKKLRKTIMGIKQNVTILVVTFFIVMLNIIH